MSESGPRRSAEHAYTAIREGILSGELAPGAVLSQVRLAAELGVSRTPLREGLRRLEAEGLVASDFNRRVTVSSVSLVDLDELYAMRLLLEPLALRISVPSLSAAELDGLREGMERMVRARRADDDAAFHAAHRAFHLGMAAHCGDRLRRTVGDLWDEAERYRREFRRRALLDQVAENTADDHRAILDAALLRDGEGAAEALTQHLLRTSLSITRAADARAHPLAILQAVPEAADFDPRTTHRTTDRTTRSTP